MEEAAARLRRMSQVLSQTIPRLVMVVGAAMMGSAAVGVMTAMSTLARSMIFRRTFLPGQAVWLPR